MRLNNQHYLLHGSASLTLKDLTAGNYDVTVSYPGDNNYYNQVIKTNFTVDINKKVNLNAGSNDDFDYDDFSSRPEFPSLYSAIESLPMEQHSQFANLLASGDISITCK